MILKSHHTMFMDLGLSTAPWSRNEHPAPYIVSGNFMPLVPTAIDRRSVLPASPARGQRPAPTPTVVGRGRTPKIPSTLRQILYARDARMTSCS